ncbi:MAG: chemotaxis protein CheW [Acidobacteriota bacterium]|jgi:purine-binding chemotaxis protein CheW|nr:chemotaxis protein CheW [Bryobacteraceae bacterium CoA2 C42]
MPVIEGTAVQPYLTFKLGAEVFALEVKKVREVLDFTTITKIPRTPEFLRGVINLRGSVVPVVDLRLGFGLDSVEPTVNTCIIVVEVVMAQETIIVGALADAVEEVIDIDASDIQPPPRLGSAIQTDFIQGMGKRENGFLMILNIDRIFSTGEVAQIVENVA